MIIVQDSRRPGLCASGRQSRCGRSTSVAHAVQQTPLLPGSRPIEYLSSFVSSPLASHYFFLQSFSSASSSQTSLVL